MKRLVHAAGAALAAVAMFASAAQAAMPGKNGRIAFEQVVAGGHAIVTVDPDGGDLRQLTPTDNSNLSYTDQSIWSPSGRKLLYFADGKIRTIDADGSGVRDVIPIYPNAGLHLTSPAWSPDGKKLAFAGYSGDPNDPDMAYDEIAIWTVGVDGKGLKRLRVGNLPVWSADGSIAYVTTGVTCPTLRTMRPDGSHVRTLYKPRKCGGDPGRPGDFSPSGRTLVISRAVGDRFDLYSIDVRTRRMTQLTKTGKADEEAPRFSPDGKRIIYVRRGTGPHQPGVWGTFTATPRGGDVKRFSEEISPVAWQPLR
jgi:Tol biopolymer transport system component